MDDSMISLQDVLFENENVLWQGKPNKLCYVVRSAMKHIVGALMFALFDGFFIFILTTSVPEVPKEVIVFLIGFFALHLLPVWLFIGSIIKAVATHKNVEYAITDKRVIVRTGVVGLDFDNINYSDISNIRVDVSVLEKFFKVGTVVVTTSSNNSVCLLSVEEPYAIYKKLNKTFMDMKSDIHFPNAWRPAENPGYNTKYTGQ